MIPPSQRSSAPEFPEGVDWLNTERPLSMLDLQGKVVLLDFWTYCCINCMHILPDLKRLERKYADELVVVGVHSAKFTAEQDTENIRQAVLRYDIEHPVVNDPDLKMWRQYDVPAWPTVVLVDPAGRIAATHSGEGVFEAFDRAISLLTAEFDARGQLDRTPPDRKLERAKAVRATLAFPGKVLADEPSGRLFIADSGHNRIVIASLDDGAVQAVAGTGQLGMRDGSFDEATFRSPQGMALDGERLYVADTQNHAIRALDLERRTVRTVAGTGRQAPAGRSGGDAESTPLNSPWDLVLHDDVLYVAMAGSHQLWRFDLAAGRVERHAGSGREARVDGPLREAALAQPSGLATDGSRLYFADSEASSIRSADLDRRGMVRTIVGGDLFEFGDRDARGLRARLQHPLGVAYHDGALFVADTYNNKIKRVDPQEGTIETFLGTGEAGARDGEHATFDEPGGLSVAGGKLYVADTNNHLIRVADLEGGMVETLAITGLRMPGAAAGGLRATYLPEQTVRAGEARLRVTLALPDGYKLNPRAPSLVKLASETIAVDGEGQKLIRDPRFPLELALNVPAGRAELLLEAALYYCRADEEGLCYFHEAALRLPVRGAEGEGPRELAVPLSVEAPR